MKSGTVIRKIDDLGRLVVPVDIRRKLEIAVREPLEIYSEGNKIIIKKVAPEAEPTQKRKALRAVRRKPVK